MTLLYAGTFFAVGAFLVTVMYVSLDHWLERRPAGELQRTVREYVAGALPGTRPTDNAELSALIAEHAARDRGEILHAMLLWSLSALGVFGIAATALGWLLAGKVLSPLQQITATARRVADLSLHERIALRGPRDELKDLADTFDSMLERLDRAFDSQRRFVANASHELRTPLAIGRTLIEVVLNRHDTPESLRQWAQTLLEVNQRHEMLIDGLLLLAVSEQPLRNRQQVDLAELARCATALSPDSRGDRLTVTTHLAPATTSGNPILLERVVGNLLDNAARYNISSGWIRVATGTADDHVWLTVDNSGELIPSFEIAGLFEPFRRRGTASTSTTSRGAGLGLSIVRSVVAAHSGAVTAQPRPGGGLTVRVRLPISAPQDPAESARVSSAMSRESSLVSTRLT
ncbi:sensor histidine kinase [Nocardia wallacei]|uniref:sensor histidine kinase n=1 Tax=Nocardia wallacei TaxID=480035 RepID=UPI0024540AF4|nr:ATP-binding protein [Nocardia wallacei]